MAATAWRSAQTDFPESDGGAAVFHYGSRDGKIPARPFGISASDETEVLDIIENFLQIPV